MSDYQIDGTKADNIGGCNHCGHKNVIDHGHRRKPSWLRDRFGRYMCGCSD